MRREYYKSLDRPLNIFGLRGGWIKNFGIFCGIAFGVAVVVGIAMGMGPAMGIFIAGLAVSFFACLVLQAKTPARRLGKVRLRQKMNVRVIRRETLSRIVLDDPRYISKTETGQ